MTRGRTLRVRFALWTAGLFLLGLSAFAAFIYASMARGLQAAQDEALAIVAAQVAAGVDLVRGRPVFAEDFAGEPENQSLLARGFTVRILDTAGAPLQGLGGSLGRLEASAWTTPGSTTLRDEAGGEGLRTHTTILESGGRAVATIQVAQSRRDVEATLRRLRSTLFISVPLLVALTGATAYFLAARALAPIDRVTRTARDIAEGSQDLSARLELPRTDDEVGRLTSTFNAMLTRLQDSFRRERQFTADASHDLRTPVAAIESILGMIRQRRRAPEAYELALADIATEADRLRTLIDRLLVLTREEAEPAEPPDLTDVSTLLGDVVESLAHLAAEKGLALESEVDPGLVVQGSRDDLARLFVNLVENAVKFTVRGTVRISGSDDGGGWTRVAVRDTGPGIPAEQLPFVFDRFFRGDQARSTPGAGLGLALAAAVAARHGGRIEVSSRVGEGSEFIVFLPKAGPGRGRASPGE